MNEFMYLEAILLERTLPCLAEPGKIVVIGKPSCVISEVIPYLATLPGVTSFNPENLALTFRRQHGFITIFPERITITQVRDASEGLELLAALRDAINAVWQERDRLSPRTARRLAARPLDVWMLLPRSNCGACGEATCMAFAVHLIQGKCSLERCPDLITNPTYTNQRTTLEALV